MVDFIMRDVIIALVMVSIIAVAVYYYYPRKISYEDEILKWGELPDL
jgi:hypothetical protein